MSPWRRLVFVMQLARLNYIKGKFISCQRITYKILKNPFFRRTHPKSRRREHGLKNHITNTPKSHSLEEDIAKHPRSHSLTKEHVFVNFAPQLLPCLSFSERKACPLGNNVIKMGLVVTEVTGVMTLAEYLFCCLV